MKRIIIILILLILFCFAYAASEIFYGNASFYARQFHGKKTASGEIFDMYKMTAAHKTLPFGTVLRVTNLSNNAYVLVTVNDRGPFVANRVLDLSYAAAQKLGYVRNGVTKIKAEVVSLGNNARASSGYAAQQQAYSQNNRRNAPQDNNASEEDSIQNENTSTMHAPAPAPQQSQYLNQSPTVRDREPEGGSNRTIGRILRIQLGAFKFKENAEQLATKLKGLGVEAEVVEIRGGDGYYYKVYSIEKFRELNKALTLLDQIRAKNIECFIIGQYYTR